VVIFFSFALIDKRGEGAAPQDEVVARDNCMGRRAGLLWGGCSPETAIGRDRYLGLLIVRAADVMQSASTFTGQFLDPAGEKNSPHP
jgi:hypothetical protein